MPIFFKYKRIVSLLLIFLISGFGVLGLARPVRASAGDMLLEGATALATWGIKIFAGCLQIAVKLLTKILNWDNFIEAPIVEIGWTITRDLANMFFVLILLMIAFGLILRKETYGSKTLLVNLIIAALLINFSLVIAGVIIDSSQVLTDFFISQSGGTASAMEGNLMNATQAVRTITVREDVVKEVIKKDSNSVALDNFIGALISVIFLFITFFVFAAYALFLIVRIVYLWVLLIFAPLVWLLWTLPATKKFWGMWWNNFIKWCFFAPVSAFFIYLSITSYKALLTANLVAALQPSEAAVFLPKITEPASLVSYILIIALLFGGIRVAQIAGVWGANGSMNLAKWGKNKTINWAKERTARPTGRVTGAISEQLAKRGGFLGRQAARPLRAASEKTKAFDRAAIERYEKKYKPYGNDNLISEFKGVITNAHAKTAIAKILADRNKFKEGKEDEKDKKKVRLTDNDINQALDIAKKYNMHKDLLKSNLGKCSYAGEDPYEIIKSMKAKDMENISLEGIIDKATNEILPDVKEALIKHLTGKGGVINKNFLSELSKNNFSVFEKIQNDIIKTEIMPKDKWDIVKEVRGDITSYLTSNAGKALFHEVIGGLDWLEEEKKKKKEEERKKKREEAQKKKPPIGFKA